MFVEVKKLNKRIATRLAIAAAVASGMVVVMMFIAVTRPKHPQFCAKCHNNISFTNGCKKSLPGDIACIECHTHGNTGIKVMAVEIRDEHCTGESCHPVSKLSDKTVQYKKVTPFQHKTHIGNLTSNLKLRCTSCHANINGERHFETDVTTCNTCHFINTMKPLYAQDNRPVSDCSLCHGHIEKTVDIYGKVFRHEVYETNEKVRCSHCHFETIRGNGRVDKKSCYRCHSEVADNFKNASDMHHVHIEEHKIACTLCHEFITHGWDRSGDVDDGGNSGLYADTADYKVQELIMMGMGGIGIKGEPDPMYIATLHCSACHKEERRYANVNPNICNNCHEKGFDRILAEQMRFVTSQMRLLRSLLKKAKRRRDVNTNQVIYEAEANYNLIREDGSLGAHNIKYVKYLLDYSITNLKRIMKYSENPDTSSFSTGSCTDRCHVNYMAYRTVYQVEVFRHKTHSPNQGLACSQCHKDDAVHTKTHGGLIIENKDCWVCHHKRVDKILVNSLPSEGNENFYNSLTPLSPPLIKGNLEGLAREEKSRDGEDCLKCHAEVKDYIKGSIQNMIPKIPDWMSQAVSCTDCHKPESDGYSFKSVREYCIECHNQDYGLLYDAWKKVLEDKIKQFSVNGDNVIRKDTLRLIQSYGIHNFRLSQILLNHD